MNTRNLYLLACAAVLMAAIFGARMLTLYAARDPALGNLYTGREAVASNAVLRAVVGAQRIVELRYHPRPATAARADDYYLAVVDHVNRLGGVERTNLLVVVGPVATARGDVLSAYTLPLAW